MIEYNNSQTESKDFNSSQELQQIKTYAEKLGVKQLSLSDLEQSNPSNSPNSNKALYWGLGIVGVLAGGIVVWLLLRDKNKEK